MGLTVDVELFLEGALILFYATITAIRWFKKLVADLFFVFWADPSISVNFELAVQIVSIC